MIGSLKGDCIMFEFIIDIFVLGATFITPFAIINAIYEAFFED